jgi:hypothetical protein
MSDFRTSGGTNLLPRAFLYWLPLAFSFTLLAGLVYVTVQQNFRQDANDPQIQMAEDAAMQSQDGAQAQTVVGTGKVDMARSLTPFLIVYDATGQLLASSAQLNGAVPALPPGVLDSARASGEDRLTWQPQEGVRVAAVVTPFGGSRPGFVLAGRSLREVEERESRLTQLVGIALIVGIIGSFVLWMAVLWLSDRLFIRPGAKELS